MVLAALLLVHLVLVATASLALDHGTDLQEHGEQGQGSAPAAWIDAWSQKAYNRRTRVSRGYRLLPLYLPAVIVKPYTIYTDKVLPDIAVHACCVVHACNLPEPSSLCAQVTHKISIHWRTKAQPRLSQLHNPWPSIHTSSATV